MESKFHIIDLQEYQDRSIPGFICFSQGGQYYIDSAEIMRRDCCIESTWRSLTQCALDNPEARIAYDPSPIRKAQAMMDHPYFKGIIFSDLTEKEILACWDLYLYAIANFKFIQKKRQL